MLADVGATSVSHTVFIANDDGTGHEGLNAATFPEVFWQISGAFPGHEITLTDLGANDDPWESGGVREFGGGWYRLDLEDAMFEVDAFIVLRGEEDDKHLVADPIQVGLNIPAATAAMLSGADLTILAAFAGGTLTIHKGAEYSVAQGNYQDLDASSLPDLTGGSVRLHIFRKKGTAIIDVPLSVINAGTPTQKIRFTLSSEESDKVVPPEILIGTIVYKASGATSYSPFRQLKVPTQRL